MSVFKSLPKNQRLAARFPMRGILLVTVTLLVLLASSRPSLGDDPPPRIPFFGPDVGTATAEELAAAMDIPASDIISVSYGSSDPAGTHVFDSQISGFPTSGNSFAVLSSGNAANTTLPNNSGSLSGILNGLNNSQGNDLVQLTITLRVPSRATHWSIDWKFFSEEYPEYVGSSFNDAFLLETSSSTFTLTGNTVNAPNNKAFDPSGNLVTINTTGAVGMAASNSIGTTYDGATTLLTTTDPIPPGASQITLIFSVMDLGDSVFDTTVFLDNFRFSGQGASQPDQINVPIRWCVLEGSQVADSPTTTASRTRVMNRFTYQPQANLIIDPTIPADFEFEIFGDGSGNDDGKCEDGESCSANLPVIQDTNTGGLNREAGYLSTKRDSLGSGAEQVTDEMVDLLTRCGEVWEYEFSRKNVSASSGIYAINVRGFINSLGITRSSLLGLASTGSQPPFGFLFVKDWQEISGDVKQTVLAHEVGHSLSLPHINDPSNLMNPRFISTDNNNLTNNASDLDDTSTQVGQVRQQARRYISARIFPEYIDPPIGDIAFALGGNLPAEESFVDITSVGFQQNVQEGIALFFSTTYGSPNNNGEYKFWYLLDTDNDASTGASSNAVSEQLGITITSEGIDYLLLSDILLENGVLEAAPTLLHYDIDGFQTITDPSIKSFIEQLDYHVYAEEGTPESEFSGITENRQMVVGIQLDSSLLGNLTAPRLQGATENNNSQVTDITNIKVLSFEPPIYPNCTAVPNVAEPGSIIDLLATNLQSNSVSDVLLGDQLITTVEVDSEGVVSISLAIPEDFDSGPQLISVLVHETAISANCVLNITYPPVFDEPPTPLMGTEFNIAVGDSLEFTIQASDPDMEDIVMLGIVDLPAGANFQSSAGNPAPGTFTWSPTYDQEGVHILTFTSVDNHGSASAPTSVVIVVQAPTNQQPTANANGPYSALEGSLVTLDGSGSFDPDGDLLDYSWDFGDGSLGNGPTVDHIFRDNGVFLVSLTVTDSAGLSSTDQTTVEVVNVPPLANAGPDQSVYRNEIVWLTGTWSDPAGILDDPYTWSWDTDGDGFLNESGTAVFGESVDATASFSLEGFYTLSFAVTDKDYGVGTDDMVVEVLNRPPVCASAVPSIATLWPDNHAFVSINVLGLTDPENDTISIVIDSIYQDEAVDSLGAGDTSPDGQGVGTATAKVRAERSGLSNGRVYHIYFTANDGHGGTCSGKVLVGVPKSQGNNGAPIDDGPLYDSTTP